MKENPFKNWEEEQEIYGQVDINSMSQDLQKKNISKLVRKLSYSIADLQSIAGLFDQKKIVECLQNYSIPSNKQLTEKFHKIYSLLQGDVETFIDYLENNGFATELINKVEKKQGINKVVKKYADMFKILFDQDDESSKEQFLFQIANIFFEFCFYPETFDQFKDMIANSEKHPILRLIYSITWANLAEIGWQHWHADCLINLRAEADAGKEVVYIAGGTDIYQLIKHGIYNIRVIDPLLPSQPKYYSNNWEWFVKSDGKKSGVGDQFIVRCEHKNISMKRVSYKTTGETLSMSLSTKKKVKIEQAVTTWHLFDEKDNKLGEVVFERRLTNQADFDFNKKKAILISFNELYFVAAPKGNDGWGINPNKFDDSINIHVKQLRKPVSKKVVCNLRHEVKQTDFAFIELGSCVD